MNKTTLRVTKSKSAQPGAASSASSTSSTSSSKLNDVLADAAAQRAMIAEAAYFRSERRGFAPGSELEDWLAAENELNTRIQGQSLERSNAGSEVH